MLFQLSEHSSPGEWDRDPKDGDKGQGWTWWQGTVMGGGGWDGTWCH